MRLQLRFHHLLTTILALFLLSLTAAFLYFGHGRLVSMAEQNAGTIFAQIAARNAARLDTMLSQAGDLVRVQANLILHLERDAAGVVNNEHLLDNFIDIIARHDEIHGIYFGLDNEDFVQLIGVREEARLAASLGAPPRTWNAIRLITHDDAGRRSEHWRFIDADGALISERVQDTDYYPSSRPWFSVARDHAELQITEPYLFASSEEIGITLAQRFRGGGGVFAVDLRLHDLGQFIASDLRGQEGGVVVLDSLGRVLVFAFTPGLRDAVPTRPLQWPDDSGDPYLRALLTSRHNVSAADEIAGVHIASVNGQPFVYAERSVELRPGRSTRIAAFSPTAAFSAPILRLGEDLTLIAAGLLAIALPLGFIVARSASSAVSELADDAERIKRFDFSGNPRLGLLTHEFQALGSAQRLMKVSLQARTAELNDALHKLQTLVDHGLLLAAERDPERLLERIEEAAIQLTQADSAELYLQQGEGQLLNRHGERLNLDGDLPADSPAALCTQAIASGQPVLADKLEHDGRQHCALMLPLHTSGAELIGVLQLDNSRQHNGSRPFPTSVIQYAKAFAAQAATAFENHQLLKAQTSLIDAMVRILANAIDAKSPYTGAHCARVPVLATMLAEAACNSSEGKFATFNFSNAEEWREFRIGAWLHDCGKITTPAYVMDKATKLETLYNRIHEIRTRFEVLWRDARISALQATLQGEDAALAEAAFEQRIAQLADDFAFIAHCNLGSEAMDPAASERLQQIGAQRWQRHFDDRLGLSHTELAQRADTPPLSLPASETLLADQAWHIVPRPANQQFGPEQGFNMDVPTQLYNFGELYNLSILHGTLNAEERFKINEHVIQSILMLEALPLPSNLKRVPEYAGTHHETLIGTGYPRRLRGADLSIPARIMAIADIFEALTAADRPYKNAKKLSEAVDILVGYAAEQHIDAELLALFLRSGVHLDYARQYLPPTQIDSVDLDAVLGRLATQAQPPAGPETALSGSN